MSLIVDGATRATAQIVPKLVQSTTKGLSASANANLNVGNAEKSHSEGGSTSASRVAGTEATAQNIAIMQMANAINAQNQANQQAYNSAEAQKNREWQERLSNTAYQRAMEDMRKAGLNPILAYSMGGASTPAGSTASSSALQSASTNAIADQIATGSGWNTADSSSNLANQFASIGDGVEQIGKGIVDFGKSNKEKIENAVTGVVEGVTGAYNKATNWLKKTFGGHKLGSYYYQGDIQDYHV